MKYLTVLYIAIVFGILTGCSTPEEQVAKEKMRLSEEYQDCIEKAKAYKAAQADGTADRIGTSDRMTDEDCETIRKNLQAIN